MAILGRVVPGPGESGADDDAATDGRAVAQRMNVAGEAIDHVHLAQFVDREGDDFERRVEQLRGGDAARTAGQAEDAAAAVVAGTEQRRQGQVGGRS